MPTPRQAWQILSVCARQGALLEGASPFHTRQGEMIARGKGVAARRGLKEACSKALARRMRLRARQRRHTAETAYEAKDAG